MKEQNRNPKQKVLWCVWSKRQARSKTVVEGGGGGGGSWKETGQRWQTMHRQASDAGDRRKDDGDEQYQLRRGRTKGSRTSGISWIYQFLNSFTSMSIKLVKLSKVHLRAIFSTLKDEEDPLDSRTATKDEELRDRTVDSQWSWGSQNKLWRLTYLRGRSTTKQDWHLNKQKVQIPILSVIPIKRWTNLQTQLPNCCVIEGRPRFGKGGLEGEIYETED